MKLFNFLVKVSAVFALALTVLNVNAACMGIGHQPRIPDAAMKLNRHD